jgi:hypothetical protein
MSYVVSKITAGVILGYTAGAVTVGKISAGVIYDTTTLAVPTANVRKKVTVQGRIFYPT